MPDADAITKCFATAISTGILLYVSPILFNVSLSFLVLPGTCVVFVATWLYMEATPSNTLNPASKARVPIPESSSPTMRLLHNYSAKVCR
jgi:hypothetical protein